jgi:hypothetical protein
MYKLHSNLNDITQISDDMFKFNYEDKLLYLQFYKEEESVNFRLFEELRITNNLNISEALLHKAFKDCQNIQDLEQKLKDSLIDGKIDIVEDQGKFHLVLYNDCNGHKEINK